MSTFTMPVADTRPSSRHPLIQRLTDEMQYPLLDNMEAVEEYVARDGCHCLFVPGDPKRNLETADAAVILPELRMTFQHVFDCAVIDDAIESTVRQTFRALKTPGLLFFQGREGQFRHLGSVEKVRDWDDYVGRLTHILGLATQ